MEKSSYPLYVGYYVEGGADGPAAGTAVDPGENRGLRWGKPIWYNSQAVSGGRGMDTERYEIRAEIIKALAHPSRLMIVDALAEGEKCVCDLQRLVGSDMSTVSKHLAVMRAAGIVKARKAGLQVYYRLAVPCIMQFFGCVDAMMEARYSALRPTQQESACPL